MQQATLVGLLGTRESADDEIAEAGLSDDLSGLDVVLYCNNLISGSPSFADQLVKVLIEDRGAATISLVGAPQRFAKHMADAAARRGVGHRVRTSTATAVAS